MSLDLSFISDIDTNMEAESNKRDEFHRIVKEYDRTCRNITAILNGVHSAPPEEIEAIARKALEKFSEVQQHIQSLAQLLNLSSRYNDIWTRTVQTSNFLAAFAVYLLEERFVTTEELQKLCGAPVNINNDLQEFHISVEEFIHSLISLTTELSRFAINSVTQGDYNRPIRISKFIKELYNGFQLLNLKNDQLRKRFDSIKYNIKKVEEVVYDVSLRKLNTYT
ncbi:6708_t:CDS:2 [Ambispora leptoticha]|uniref:6708_t:CDS:1 n=1 Tax=Ambispora leptoticha TaxID=144679 RepID=A0A9N8VKC5_9GLOM|nr:6708_t:CDS:2 [Ambispora leptoticha]